MNKAQGYMHKLGDLERLINILIPAINANKCRVN